MNRPKGGAPAIPEGRSDQDRLVLMAKALADPTRARILTMLAEGRECCGLPVTGPAATLDRRGGICVCELQEHCGLGQSKVSYHLRVLKEAGLVTERVRGKWSFYVLDGQGFAEFVSLMERRFGLTAPGGK